MSEVLKIREVILPAIGEHLQTIEMYIWLIEADISRMYELGCEDTSVGIERLHLIVLDTASRTILKMLANILVACKEDPQFSALVHESNLVSHKPRYARLLAWKGFTNAVAHSPHSNDRFGSSEIDKSPFYLAMFHATAINEIAIDGIGPKYGIMHLREIIRMRGIFKKLTEEIDLLWDFFYSLDREVTLH